MDEEIEQPSYISDSDEEDFRIREDDVSLSPDGSDNEDPYDDNDDENDREDGTNDSSRDRDREDELEKRLSELLSKECSIKQLEADLHLREAELDQLVADNRAREVELLKKEADLQLREAELVKREMELLNKQGTSKLTSVAEQENEPPAEIHIPTIQEEEKDDLIPLSDTPPKSHPRQSIGQWSVERRKNNMSVRSMVSNFEGGKSKAPSNKPTTTAAAAGTKLSKLIVK